MFDIGAHGIVIGKGEVQAVRQSCDLLDLRQQRLALQLAPLFQRFLGQGAGEGSCVEIGVRLGLGWMMSRHDGCVD